VLPQIARQSLGQGYAGLMLTASVVAFVAAAVAWILIDPAETPAISEAFVPVAAEASVD
jgi:hypothetical protein